MFRLSRALRIALFALCALCAGAAQAQWPTRPVRLIIPFAPGGGTDILARIIAPRLSDLLGQQVVVENKPGASSIIGSQIVAQAPADGYTVMMVDSSILVNPGLRSDLPYDTLRDFTPVIHLAEGPVILVVNAAVPARTLGELVALAREKPGTLFYGSGGNGASTHLAGELFNSAAGVKIAHVPYKGTGEALAAVVAGQVPMTFTGISSARPSVESGRLRALALTGNQRSPAMPDVPTFDQAGVRGVDASSHWGMLGPARMDPEAVTRLNAAINQVLAEPAIRERVVGLGYNVAGGPPRAYADLLASEIAKWREVILKAGIKAD